MRRFLILIVLVMAAIVGWRGYLSLTDPVTGPLSGFGAPRATPFEPTISCSEAEPVPSVLDVPPGEMLQVVRSGYRALPDRRFLLAFAHAQHLLTGAPAGEIGCVYAGGRWTIHYDGVLVGELGDLSGFTDAASLLRDWIGTVADATGFAVSPQPYPDEVEELEADAEFLHRFDTRSVADAMRRIDARWREGRRSAAGLKMAARGLTAIALQAYDPLQIGDAIPARALAVVALAQATTTADVRREEALVAHTMGYTADARVLVATLPDDDPVHLFVDHDDDALEAVASGGESTPLIRHLYGLRLVATLNPDIARPWLDREKNRPDDFGLTRLRPLVAMGRMETDSEFAALIPYVAIYDLWRVGLPDRLLEAPFRKRLSQLDLENLGAVGQLLRERWGVRQGALAERFEKDLVLLDARFPGPFLDGWTFRSHFAGHFYAGLWQLSTLVLDDLASAPQAQELAHALEAAPEGTAAELHRWYGNLAEAGAGLPSTQALEGDLDELRLLGGPALFRTYQELRTHARPGVATLDRPARRLTRRIDARVENRIILARIASRVRDLPRSGDLWYSAVEAAPELEWRKLWLMSREGDGEGLKRYATDSERPLRYRVSAFGFLADSVTFGDDPSLLTLGRALVDRNSGYWVARNAYIEYLESRGRHREAGQVAEEWLRVARRPDEAELVWARTAVAGAHHALGEEEEAWRWIAPLADGEDPGAVGIAALILQSRGQEEEALRTAQRLAARYPTLPETRALLAEVLWKQHRDPDVVPVLNQPGYPLEAWDWRLEIAPRFLRAFSSRPVGEAVAAAQTLFQAGVSDVNVSALGLGLQRLGRPDLAFAIVASLPTGGDWVTLERPLWAYEYMRGMRGETAALSWLRPKVPVRQLAPFAQLVYGEGAYELLWSLVEDPDATPFPEYLWLLRAAAHADGWRGGASREGELLAHYESFLGSPEAHRDFYAVMGAYLVGLLPQEQALALADTPDRRCEAAYAIGLKAEGEGRLADAADWYQVVLHTEQSREGEFHWARTRLGRLNGRLIRSGLHVSRP